MFGARAAMESDTSSAGYLQQNGERTLKARRDSHIDAIGKRGDEIIGIFKGVTNVMQTLYEFIQTLVVVMRAAV